MTQEAWIKNEIKRYGEEIEKERRNNTRKQTY